MGIDKTGLRKRQIMIGKARELYNQGYTTTEIAEKMNLSESTVRSIKNTIDNAVANGYKES